MVNARRALDPRWLVHHRAVPSGFMLAPITITRRNEESSVWDPATGTVSGGADIVWQGPARIQPNKDWRVRYVESGTDPQLMHIVRVQIPLRPDNMPPLIKGADMIRVDTPDESSTWMPDVELRHWRLLVRNMINSSNPWVRNISAVVDLSDPQGE